MSMELTELKSYMYLSDHFPDQLLNKIKSYHMGGLLGKVKKKEALLVDHIY